jgi:predicted  nucleic acid-binding Zn-ribbon protein
MNALMTTLNKIQDECRDENDKKKEQKEEKEMDEFTRLKKQISRDIKDVRKRIEERNELLGKMDNNTTTVRMSSDIRNRLKNIQKDAEELQQLQQQQAAKLEKKKASGKEIDPAFEKEVSARAELVELAFKHIEECKQLEKSGYKNSNLSGYDDGRDLPKPTITSLPDIDDEGFQTLKKQDQVIDEKLELVGQGVNILKDMAHNYTREIEMQEVLIREAEKQVDKTQIQLDNLNKRLKNTLNKVRSCDRFVLDFILLVIVLAIAGYIYKMIAG